VEWLRQFAGDLAAALENAAAAVAAAATAAKYQTTEAYLHGTVIESMIKNNFILKF